MNAPKRFLLGVDGGNTKTIAVISSEDGTIVGTARGGATDIYGRDTPAAAIDELCRVVGSTLKAAGIESQALVRSAFSLAGADWPEDFELLDREISAHLALSHSPIIVNDALGALRSGVQSWEGISVACGTFNAIGARNRDGRIFHLGFWPDRVGGYDLGMKALCAVYRQSLDLGPRTSLTERALEAFNCNSVPDLMHSFVRRDDRIPMKNVQRLTPLLLDEAQAADPVSRSIVAEAGRILGDQACVSAARVGLPIANTPIVLTGGVLGHPSALLADAIVERLPGAIPLRTRVPPVIGALLLAYDADGKAMDPDALAQGLNETIHLY